MSPFVRQDRRAVVAEKPVDQDRVAGTRKMRAERHAFADRANPRRGDEQLIASASVHDLGVAGDDLHAGILRGLRHGAGELLAQQFEGDALLHDHGTGEIERGRAPPTARSLTVPHTASLPISPPGKMSGSTTKLSVVKASRSP